MHEKGSFSFSLWLALSLSFQLRKMVRGALSSLFFLFPREIVRRGKRGASLFSFQETRNVNDETTGQFFLSRCSFLETREQVDTKVSAPRGLDNPKIRVLLREQTKKKDFPFLLPLFVTPRLSFPIILFI